MGWSRVSSKGLRAAGSKTAVVSNRCRMIVEVPVLGGSGFSLDLEIFSAVDRQSSLLQEFSTMDSAATRGSCLTFSLQVVRGFTLLLRLVVWVVWQCQPSQVWTATHRCRQGIRKMCPKWTGLPG